ncbi:hypothetical protein H6F93_10105 [Leptolyngbya sp. FACHB-671]|nr:hypothetical protein [Leptolyngbya sp. FACHB-671]
MDQGLGELVLFQKAEWVPINWEMRSPLTKTIAQVKPNHSQRKLAAQTACRDEFSSKLA